MNKKILKALPLVALLGLMVAVPASTQGIDVGEMADDAVSLPLLLAVNRLELTTDQMESILAVLEGVVAERDVVSQLQAAFTEEMLRFDGTAEQLDERLAAHRTEIETVAEGLRERIAEAVDGIKATLSMAQGEVLQRVIPQLFGGPAALRRDAAAGNLRERAARRSEIDCDAETVDLTGELRMTGRAKDVVSRPEIGERLGREEIDGERIAMRLQQMQAKAGRGLCPEDGSPQGGGLRMTRVAGGMRGGLARSSDDHTALGWVEDLVEILTLKLENSE